jgi:hypothetical protein
LLTPDPDVDIAQTVAICETKGLLVEQNNVSWTILRPTLIYTEGRDTNITPLSHLIRRFGFMPLVDGEPGLRQPVPAEDLAIGAISAARSSAAANKFYSLPGAETLAYREMIGRIFDGLRLPRRTISVPAFPGRAGFILAKPFFLDANVAMGIRMMKDMTFDSTPAIRELRLESKKLQSRVRLVPQTGLSSKPSPSIHEHHGLAAVEDHPIIPMVAYRACQQAAFDIASLANKIFGRVAMADVLEELADGRHVIERG